MYHYIANVGNTDPGNPLTYCAVSGLESGFNNTLGNAYLSPNSAQCQAYMSQYCAKNWDGVCEYLEKDSSRIYPSATRTANNLYENQTAGIQMTKGQLLLKNTATEKYLKMMSDNCTLKYEQFDPTVSNSPLISRWVATDDQICIPVYDVKVYLDPNGKLVNEIDNDIVMDKLLTQPWIAMDLFTNIYNTRVYEGTLDLLKGTKIGNFFNSQFFRNNFNKF
jgi:hypothetical protein